MPDSSARTQVFISYASANRPIVRQIYDDLKGRGIQVWIDQSGLEPGTPDWEQTLRDAIRSSWAVLLMASPHSRQSLYVKDELRIASLYRCKVFPAWIEGDELMEALPMGLGGTQTIDMRGERYADGLVKLSAALVKGVSGASLIVPPPTTGSPADASVKEADAPISPTAPALPATFVPRNPYKGLKAFTGEDSGDFFGRERLIDELTDALRDIFKPGDPASGTASRLLAVVIGPSGSGKSSVVMAGLLPYMQRGALPGSDQWVYLPPMVPGAHPLESLALSLAERLPQRGPSALAADLKDDAGRGLHLLARQIAGQSGGPQDRRVVLLVDQFEELFTLTVDETERRRFIDLLVTAVTEPRGALLAILTLRADFYDRPLNYPGLGALLEGHSKAVLPMEIDDLRAVIEKPAALPDVRLTFEDGLVGDLLFEVRGEAAALPLLQFTLEQLFERRDGLRLTRHAYQEIGGVRGALAKHAEDTFKTLASDDHRRLARALFLRLIEPGATEQDTTRRRAALSELTLDDPAQTAMYTAVARAFIEARLLTTGKIGNQTTIEVSHEALIREWQRLGDWLKEARDDVHLQSAVAQAALEWTARSSRPDDDGLYRGSLLLNAQDWAKRNVPSATESAFLNSSAARQADVIALEERRKQELIDAADQARTAERRATLVQRAALAVSALAIVIFIVATFSFVTALNSVANAHLTLTPISQAMNVAQTSVADANQNAGVVVSELAVESSQVANVNATLTPAFNTQVAVATQIVDSQARNDALHWAVRAGDLASSSDYLSRTQALLLSVRALRQSDSPDAEVSLYKTLNGYMVPQLLNDGPNAISSVAFSPDGHQMLTGSDDGLARLWDVATAQGVRVFRGHTNGVTSVTFSPDGKAVLTGSYDGTARLWDAATGHVIQVFSGHTNGVYSVAFSPDGKQVLTGSADYTARLWDVRSGQTIQTFSGHINGVQSVAFSPDGAYALTGSDDATARLWNVRSGQLLRIFSGHTNSVLSVAFSPDGAYALTGSYDTTARLWDIRSGQLQRIFSGGGNPVRSVAFSLDGASVLVGSGNTYYGTQSNEAWLWDIRSGQRQRVFRGHTGSVNAVTFSPDGRYLLTGSSDATARLWDVTTAASLRTFSGHIPGNGLAVSPDGRYVLVGAQLWDVHAWQWVRSLTGHTSIVTSAAFSPDGRYALTGSDDNSARLWDVSTGVSLRTFSGHTRAIYAVAFSPDGKSVLTGSGDATARLWDVGSGQLVQTFSGHTDVVTSVAFSPDGKSVLTGSDDGTAWLWDATSGKHLRTFSGQPGHMTSVAFAPDGKRVLTGSTDSTAWLWDVNTGAVVRVFSGHNSRVSSVAFSPDGRYMLTGSDDKTARLWDVGSGQRVRTFSGHTNGVVSVAFSPDRHLVLTAGGDGTVRLWPLDYPDVLADVCTWLPRDFTPDERQMFGIRDPAPTCPQFARGSDATPLMPPTSTAPPSATPFTVTALPPIAELPSATPGQIATRTLTLTPSETYTPTATATLALSSSATALASPTASQTFTPTATFSPTATATLIPGIFDLSALVPFQPPDNGLTLKMPAVWTAIPESTPGRYFVAVGAQQAYVLIVIGDTTALYQTYMGLGALPDTPQAALLARSGAFGVDIFGAVHPTQIGTLDGFGIQGKTIANGPSNVDLRIAALPDGRLLYVQTFAQVGYWDEAQPVLEAITASIVVGPPLPTSTPTPLFTATATATVTLSFGGKP